MRRGILVLLIAGCDLLFPEFAGQKPADADAGTMPHIAGSVCALGDLRDYRSCSMGTSNAMRVTAEETRDAAAVDATGHFTLPLSKMLPHALLAAADGNNTFAPTVTTVALTGGSADAVAVPLVAANILAQVAQENGIALDTKKGVVFGWATDGKGTPVAGIAAQAPAGADGPYYDGPAASEIAPGSSTGSHGLVAFFNVPPGDAQITVGDRLFQVPVRPSALSLSLLIAP
jgi:hypothetical protein